MGRRLLLAAFAVLVVSAAEAQDMLDVLTFEQCNDSSFFEEIKNGTLVGEYVAANGAVLHLGDTLMLGTPTGSRATSTGGSTMGGATRSGNVAVGASVSMGARTNVSAQYATLLMGKPEGLGNLAGSLSGDLKNRPSGNMQGQAVIIAEMSVRHDGGRKKPLELVILLGEPNGRAFGINKYMSTTDYEASAIAGELRPLNAPLTRDEAIAKLKEAKDLLDLGLMSEQEYNAVKEELTPIIMPGR
jgi:hypothetical protein